MKIMTRIMGLAVAGFIAMMAMLQLINVDIRRDEMETITTLAMNQTQTIAEEYIADDLYETNNARKRFTSNEEYFQDYVNNFQKLVTSDCVYQIDLMYADYEKGILDVNVTCEYKNIIGQEASMSERKTSIIETVDMSSETKVYYITYDLQKGRLIGKNPTSYSKGSAGDIILINPFRTGYEFVGWTGSNGDEPQMTVRIDKDGEEDLFFVANWDMLTYNITYDANGGTLAPGNPSRYTIETDSFNLLNPSKSYYDFKGWTGSSGNTPQYNVTIKRGSTGDRHYKANWAPTQYGITYVLNGGTNNASNPGGYDVEDADITLKNPTRTGYNFQGWYTDSNLANKITKIDTAQAKNLTLYAKWSAKSVTVTFHKNYGTDATTTKTYTYGASGNTFAVPSGWTETGYYLKGWYDSAEKTTRLFDAGASVSNDWIISNDGKTIHMYGGWTEKWVKLRIYHNNGTTNYTTYTFYYGKGTKIPSVTTLESAATPPTGMTVSGLSTSASGAVDTTNLGLNTVLSNTYIDSNHGNINKVYIVWKSKIIYGYKTAATYSTTYTTTAPTDTYYYKTGSVKVNHTFDLGSANSYGLDKKMIVADRAFVPTKISYGTYCHTSVATLKWYGSNTNSWNTSTGTYLGTGNVKKGSISMEYSGTSNLTGTTAFRYYFYQYTYSSPGFKGWNGSNACTGTSEYTNQDQSAGIVISGYYNTTGYYKVATWSAVTKTTSAKTRTRSLMPVYSMDDGATWIECPNGVCPSA
ncbi:MAG: InlB B-repeat-containing protein [Erysipelotrichaceae bacterium]|nr:InlB B-repeat-containing protein [Erysipelotrichaceae bacterium]